MIAVVYYKKYPRGWDFTS